MNEEGFPSSAELCALAALQGVELEDADLAGVRGFLQVFLPAAAGLSELLPAEARAAAPPALGEE